MNESDFKVQGYNSKNFSGFSGGARAAAATATDPDDDEDDDEEAECGHGKPCVSSDGASDTFLVQVRLDTSFQPSSCYLLNWTIDLDDLDGRCEY